MMYDPHYVAETNRDYRKINMKKMETNKSKELNRGREDELTQYLPQTQGDGNAREKSETLLQCEVVDSLISAGTITKQHVW